VEPVDVLYEDGGRMETTPLLTTRECSAPLRDVRSMLGLPLEPELIIRLCEKMQLGPARLEGEGQQQAITVR
jgi:hypothetical protein